MKYILVLWLTWNSGGTSPEGAIETAQFETKQSCNFALKAIIKKAENIDGICVEN